MNALQGMKGTLSKYSPDLVLEVLQQQVNGLKEFLCKLGYKTYLIGQKGWLQEGELTWNPNLNRDWYATKKPAKAYLSHR